jgi:short-subunit dehydrogenase
VIALTSSLQSEFDHTGVDISCVMPGIVRTELSAGLAPDSGLLKATSPATVARAVAGCVARPRHTVHVPAATAAGITLMQFVPLRVRRALERVSGMENIALHAAGSARSAYEDRVARSRPASLRRPPTRIPSP